MAAVLLFFIFVILKVVLLSHCHICMTYTIGQDYLRLSCKIANLEFEVLLSDPNNQEQAFCLISYPNPLCRHHYRNSSIEQNLSTNETVLTIRGRINENINGQWMCRHGNNFEKATVDVRFNAISGVNRLEVAANQTLPFPNDTFVEITCTAETFGRFAEITWDCLNISNFKTSILNCSIALSKIMYRASTVDNGSLCKCMVKNDKLFTSTYIKLNIQTNFEIQLIEHTQCNTSTPLVLTCDMIKFYPKSGFAPWIHSYNGIFIRYMKDVINGTRSTISINACSLVDTGQYSCRAWVQKQGKITWENKTTSLIINGPPVIITAGVKRELYLTLFVWFVCTPSPDIIEWYSLNTPIHNQTYLKSAASKIVLSQDFYGKHIGVDGYAANVTLPYLKDVANYENTYVMIKNTFGNTTYFYSVQKDDVFFRRQLLQWILIIVAVFVISVVGTALLITKRSRMKGHDDPTDIAIYYAAPETNNQPANVYNDIQYPIEQDSNINQYIEIETIPMDTDKDSIESGQSLPQAHYVDVI